MSIFHPTQFFITVAQLNGLPQQGLPEVAFAGRSNAGKSTMINTLTNQKRLAFASKTPGRTQHINFFSVIQQQAIKGFLVDLPGYGFADMPIEAKAHWNHLIGEYVRHRPPLQGLVIIMDARRPFTDLDQQMLEWMLPSQKPIHIVLNKSDKLNRSESSLALRKSRQLIEPFQKKTAGEISIQLFSAPKKVGLDTLEAKVMSWLSLDRLDSSAPNASDATDASDT